MSSCIEHVAGITIMLPLGLHLLCITFLSSSGTSHSRMLPTQLLTALQQAMAIFRTQKVAKLEVTITQDGSKLTATVFSENGKRPGACSFS